MRATGSAPLSLLICLLLGALALTFISGFPPREAVPTGTRARSVRGERRLLLGRAELGLRLAEGQAQTTGRSASRALLAAGVIPEGEQGSVRLPGPFLAMAYDFACGITDNGALLCGENVGFNDTLPMSLRDVEVAAVAVGQSHACALDTYGAMTCWGSVAQKNVPSLPSGTTWAAVSCGGGSACGITSCGALQCWYNPDEAYGDMPPGTNAPTLNNTYWVSISVGGTLACGIDSAAQMHCWAIGMAGSQLTWAADSGQTWRSVAAGLEHACGINGAGGMSCAPTFSAGGQTTPPALPAGRTWEAVAAGTSHTCGIDSEGGMHCFGSAEHTASPTLDAGLTWAAVTCASVASCGLDSSGKLHCWGPAANSSGLESLDIVWMRAVAEYAGSALNSTCINSLFPDRPLHDAPPSSAATIGIIAGAVVGGIVLLVVALAGFLVWRRRKDHKDESYWRALLSSMPGSSQGSSGLGKRSKPSVAREHLQLWEVDYNDREFEEQGELGRGSFGTVIKARWFKNQQLVAVKKFDVREGTALEELESEASLMVNLQNPNIVQFYGLCLDPPCMIMEYCANGSLSDLLKKALAGDIISQLTWPGVLHLAMEIAKGMLFLHSSLPPIIHRDLKTPNVLIANGGNVKVADFGLSKLAHDTGTLNGSLANGSLANNNPRWLAPEILDGMTASRESDVYAFGVVMWELLTWELPWSQYKHPAQIITQILNGNCLEVPPISELPGKRGTWSGLNAYVSLMKRCTADIPTQRPTFQEVIKALRNLSEELREEFQQARA